MIWVLVAVCLMAAVPYSLRWLRVAQREHYLPGSVSPFVGRWWLSGTVNKVLWGLVTVIVVAWIAFGGRDSSDGGLGLVWPGILAAVVLAISPVGLSVRGRTSPLAWTPRMKRLAFVTGLLFMTLLMLGIVIRFPHLIFLGLWFLPLIVDLALLILRPVEARLGRKWVDKASRKLTAIGPEVVAITGSYGKTTTKGYVAHLLSGSKRVVASPASFNNQMGLARAINENLAPGTQVFVAEMGTYGKGEIADLCRWVTPRVAAMVSIGPVHLERFKSEARIAEAKAEILDQAEVGVICVDHPLLADLAAERASSMPIIEVGTRDRGRVRVVEGRLLIDDAPVAEVSANTYPENLAVAAGIALAMGVDMAAIRERMATLPTPEHRLTASTSADSGFDIIDDTFNSNPAGARRALEKLLETGSGQKALVTPGMVELGPIQNEENTRFAADAAASLDHLVIVGRTNRPALQRGAANGRASVTVVDTREQAVAWVRSNLGPGDTVLYENDLPDHYP